MNYKRFSIIGGVFLCCAIILVVGLFVISVLKSGEYSERVASQRAVTLNVKNCRGKLYDRNMIPMVEKKVSGLRVGNVSFKNADGKEIKVSTRYSDNFACHVIGYTDNSGKAVCGLEKTFDAYLATPFYKSINVIKSADGNIIDEAGFRQENSVGEGDSVVLTIDSHIQKICSKALSDAKVTGAVTVMDVSNFDVLAMASSPTYNQTDVSAYMESYSGELINRCVSPYNAGSIFKIVTLCTAIENESLMPFYVCKGKIDVGRNVFNCHRKEGHGVLSPFEALAMSCNCAFYSMGENIGAKRIISEADKFGFGENVVCCSGFEESSGNLPWKIRYSPADSANYAIGQGEILLTPLQVVNMVSVIACGGEAKKVNIASEVVDCKGKVKRVLREVGSRRIVSPKTADFVRRAMRLAVTDGTASSLKNNPTNIAGKTGTAETGWTVDGKNMVHGWFCGFFPYDNPRYAMAVLVENGGSGSMSAVPIFGKIAEEIIKFYPI